MRPRTAAMLVTIIAIVTASCGGGDSSDVAGDTADTSKDSLDTTAADTSLPDTMGTDVVDDVAAIPDTPGDLAGELPGDSTTADVPDFITATIEWGSCPSYIESMSGAEVECATVEAPLLWDDPAGATIPLFVYRVVPLTEVPKRGQIWLLQGGPGGTGASYVELIPSLAELHPEWDYYSLDHRVVGNSARLTCTQEAMTPFDAAGCAAELEATWGEGLQGFTPTGAAKDLAMLVEAAREPGDEVVVYGASYGTYWAHRYLQLFPDQPTAVVLDSVCLSGLCHLDEYDANHDAVGKTIMGRCADDATCDAKLSTFAEGADGAVDAIYQLVEDDAICAPLASVVDKTFLRNIMGFMVTNWFTRQLIPASLYRLQKCGEADQQALSNLLDTLAGAGVVALDYLETYEELDATLTLGSYIILSELWGSTPLETAAEAAEGLQFSTDTTMLLASIGLAEAWPSYTPDELAQGWATTEVPVLMMNGDLDPQTTIDMALPAADHLDGPHQTFVTFPDTPHGVLMTSYTLTSLMNLSTGKLTSCGMDVLFDFVDDPTGEVDTSCLDDVLPLELGGTSQVNQYASSFLFGTTDMWEGIPSRSGPPSLATAEARIVFGALVMDLVADPTLAEALAGLVR